MSQKIASARISTKSSALLQELNQSLPFDKVLYQEDIKGSLAHSKMLYKQGIISKDDYKNIKKALKKTRNEIKNGKFSLDGDDEDIHMAVEGRVTQIAGDSGKRLHTARSRNDQVAVDFRLYVQKNSLNIASLLLDNIDTIIKIASKHTQTLLPGMTHLQHAQPINFGFHLFRGWHKASPRYPNRTNQNRRLAHTHYLPFPSHRSRWRYFYKWHRFHQ